MIGMRHVTKKRRQRRYVVPCTGTTVPVFPFEVGIVVGHKHPAENLAYRTTEHIQIKLTIPINSRMNSNNSDQATTEGSARHSDSAAAMRLRGGSPEGGHSSSAAAVVTMTETMTETATATHEGEHEVLRLTLAARPAVRWDENVLDNEGMGRKSSKRCCIFHKQRSFGESSTDSSDNDSDHSGSSAASGASGDGDKKPRAARKHRKIARPKSDKVPDYQRFHA
jgi:protein phosphatase 1 regulatory subunit 11